MGHNVLISCNTFVLLNQNFYNLIPPDKENVCHNIQENCNVQLHKVFKPIVFS